MSKELLSNKGREYICNSTYDMYLGAYLINLADNVFHNIFIKDELRKDIPVEGYYIDLKRALLEYSCEKDKNMIMEVLSTLSNHHTDHLKRLAFLNRKKEYCRLIFSIVEETTDGWPLSIYLAIEKLEYNNKLDTLSRLAYYDSVTKGYNFNYFKEYLEQLMDIDGCIVAMNIRGFQTINSIIGVEKGNFVLKSIWDIIDDSLQRFECAAHITVDQFIIFFTEIEKYSIVKRLQKIADQIRNIRLEEDTITIESFFGVISWDGISSIDIAYSNAKSVVPKISNSLTGCVNFFDYDMASILRDHKEFEQNFEKAIRNKEFEIVFQPKYDSFTEEIIEAEALVRWNYKGRVIFPNTFISLFEKNGMISILDEYVFRQVCREQKKRIDNHEKIVPISINISRRSLYKRDIVETYSKIAEEYCIDKKYIPIEITETAELDAKRFQEVDLEFKKSGFILQIDDFGTGYCSLASLLSMDFHTLKLDKTLIDHIGLDSGNALLEYSIQLAKNMGMQVTAEGVETREQLEALKALGCDNIQGYYFSKPLEKSEYHQLLDKNSDS